MYTSKSNKKNYQELQTAMEEPFQKQLFGIQIQLNHAKNFIRQ